MAYKRRWRISGREHYTTKQTLHQSFLHHAGMDKRQKKQWDKMTKQWDEIRGLARAAGERDDQARATGAGVHPGVVKEALV